MKTIFRLIVLLLLVAGWSLAALSLHVVRTPEQIPITLVPKDRLGITDTYVDTRQWTLDDVPDHAAVVQRLLRSGKAEALRHLITDAAAGDVQTQLAEALQRPPRPKPAQATQPTTTEHAAGWNWKFW